MDEGIPLERRGEAVKVCPLRNSGMTRRTSGRRKLLDQTITRVAVAATLNGAPLHARNLKR